MVNRGNSRSHSIAEKFVYRGRTVQDVREQTTRRSRFDSPFKPEFPVWIPKQGDNLVKFLPNTWDDKKHFGLPINVHAYVGVDESTYICPFKMFGKPCPMCAAALAAQRAGDVDDAKKIGTRERTVYWVIDRDSDPPDKPMLWHMSKMYDDQLLNATINEREGSVLLIDHQHAGYDVIVKRSGQGIQTRYQSIIERASSPISTDPDIQDDVLAYVMDHPLPEVLRLYSYEHLDRVINGTTAPADTELDETPFKPEPQRQSARRDEPARGNARPPRQPVEDDTELEEEEGFSEEEEVVSAPPPRQPRTRLVAPVEDDEPEDEAPPRPRPRQPDVSRYPRR